MSLVEHISRLTRVHITPHPHGGKTTSRPLLERLQDAVDPSGAKPSAAKPASERSPVNLDAIDELGRIRKTVVQETLERTPRAPGSLIGMLQLWPDFEDQEHLEYVSLEICDSIEELLDPMPPRRPLNQPCYDCGTLWLSETADGELVPTEIVDADWRRWKYIAKPRHAYWQTEASGALMREPVRGRPHSFGVASRRVAAVTFRGQDENTGATLDFNDMDMSCAACGHYWRGKEMSWPLKVLHDTAA